MVLSAAPPLKNTKASRARVWVHPYYLEVPLFQQTTCEDSSYQHVVTSAPDVEDKAVGILAMGLVKKRGSDEGRLRYRGAKDGT